MDGPKNWENITKVMVDILTNCKFCKNKATHISSIDNKAVPTCRRCLKYIPKGEIIACGNSSQAKPESARIIKLRHLGPYMAELRIGQPFGKIGKVVFNGKQ